MNYFRNIWGLRLVLCMSQLDNDATQHGDWDTEIIKHTSTMILPAIIERKFYYCSFI